MLHAAMLQMGGAFAQMLPSIGIDVAATELWQGGCEVVRGTPIWSFRPWWAGLFCRAWL